MSQRARGQRLYASLIPAVRTTEERGEAGASNVQLA